MSAPRSVRTTQPVRRHKLPLLDPEVTIDQPIPARPPEVPVDLQDGRYTVTLGPALATGDLSYLWIYIVGPVAFRLTHLSDERARAVIEAVVDMAGGQVDIGDHDRGPGDHGGPGHHRGSQVGRDGDEIEP